MQVYPAKAALKVNMTLPFVGIGGVAPYAYSLQSGTGSVNAATGIYTSPETPPSPRDPRIVLLVTDANGDTVTAPIVVGTPLELICDIIRTEMGLANDRVWEWDQKINEPEDQSLFIVVSELTCKPFSNKNTINEYGESVQSTNFLTTLSIDIKSRGTSARVRKEEVVMALNSNYAESQMELNNFRIYNIPASFINFSGLDGAAIPYVFNISANLVYSVVKTQAVPYYDDFSESVPPEVITDP